MEFCLPGAGSSELGGGKRERKRVCERASMGKRASSVNVEKTVNCIELLQAGTAAGGVKEYCWYDTQGKTVKEPTEMGLELRDNR